MRRLLFVAATLLAALTIASSASAAAVLVSAPCNRYTPGLAGKKWVPVGARGGFGPSESLRLQWGDATKSLAGYAQANAAGGLFAGFFMPSAFITSRGPHVRSFGLGAFDATTGAGVGLGRVRFVRVDNGFASRRRPHQVTSYGVWGAPAGRKVWMHFYFGGRQRRVVYMGRANKPCGVLHKRIQVLPTRSRYGTWHVYFTNSPRGLSRRAIRRRHYIAFRLSFIVYKIYVPRYRAAAAGVAAPAAGVRHLR